MHSFRWTAVGLVLLALTGPAMAAEKVPTARIDVSGLEIDVKAGAGDAKVTPIAGSSKLSYEIPVEADKWKPMEIRFTPAADGKVQLSLAGQFRKDGEVWVYFDDLKVTGAEVANGDFEETGPKNVPASWTAKPGQKPVQIKDPAIVKSGKACVKASHGNRLSQVLTVKAGQEIVVTVQTRLDKVVSQ